MNYFRKILYGLYCIGLFFCFLGRKILAFITWIKAHCVMLGIVGILLIGATLSVILPMRFPQTPFLLVYLGTIAFSILTLAVVFIVAMDRIAQTIGVAIQQMALLRQLVSALHQATLKSNTLMEQELHLQNALIGKLNETENTITLATEKLVTTAGDLIRTLQSH